MKNILLLVTSVMNLLNQTGLYTLYCHHQHFSGLPRPFQNKLLPVNQVDRVNGPTGLPTTTPVDYMEACRPARPGNGPAIAGWTKVGRWLMVAWAGVLLLVSPLVAQELPVTTPYSTAKPTPAQAATPLAVDTIGRFYSNSGTNRLIHDRDSTVHKPGRVDGILLDSSTRQPVSFATVAIFDSSRTRLQGGTTADEQGHFVIVGLPAGPYWLTITAVSYQTKSIWIRINRLQSSIQLGRVWLTAGVRLLDGVEVIGQKALIEEKEDRVVYNAEKDITTRGGTATDILRKVPMVAVDLDGNLTLRGSQRVRVLINNKPSALVAGSVADALRQIPADLIKSVEVITSPSARYDGEGSAGVINIIMKKNTRPGFSLGLDGGLGNRGGSSTLGSSLRTGKMGFSLTGSGWLNYNIKGAYANSQTVGQTATSQQATTRSHAQFGQYTLGWDYDLDKSNSLTSSFRLGVRDSYANQDHLTTQALTGGGVSPTLDSRNVVTKDLSRNMDVTTVYTHLFKPGHELSLLALYSRNNRTNNFTADVFGLLDLTRLASRDQNINPSLNQETTLQLDYQVPVGKNQLLETGGKGIFRQVNSDYRYLHDSSGRGNFMVNSLYPPGGLAYRQTVLAGYVSYTLLLAKRYTLKTGVRYEYTAINAHGKNGSAPGSDSALLGHIPAYGNWLPSLSVSRTLKSGKVVRLSYTRRLQRPGIQFLNPNLNLANPLTVVQGNPLLSPERTHTVEFSTGASVKNTYLNASLFARLITQAIQPIRDTLTSVASGNVVRVLRTSYQNIGQEQAYGLNLTGNGTITSRWQVGGGVDVYYAYLTNQSANPIYQRTNAGWVLGGRLYSALTFKKGWSVQGFGLLLARQVQLQGYQGGFTFYMIGLKKDFSTKRSSLGLSAENFLNYPFRVRTELTSPVLIQRSSTSYYNAGIRLTFSYRIGSNQSPNQTRKAINNDDVKGGVEKSDKQ